MTVGVSVYVLTAGKLEMPFQKPELQSPVELEDVLSFQVLFSDNNVWLAVIGEDKLLQLNEFGETE